MLCQHGRGVVCLECHDTIRRLCVDLNASNDALIRLHAYIESEMAKAQVLVEENAKIVATVERLRAELAEAKRDAADVGLYLTRRAAEAERERDEARRERDGLRTLNRLLRVSCDEAIRQCDERPAISRPMASRFLDGWSDAAVMAALRAHAASATHEPCGYCGDTRGPCEPPGCDVRAASATKGGENG